MRRQALFFLLGSAVMFVTILAPALTLVAWLSGQSLGLFLPVAALLSWPAAYSFWYTLNHSHNMRLRWLWMQLLGLGTILMSLVILASPFTWRSNPQSIGVVVLLAWIVLAALAVWQAINIQSRFLRIHASQLAKPLRLVQISDVHIGSRSATFLHKVIQQVNQHQPDLLVITGDLLDASTVGQAELQALSLLNCPAYMCIGNHERYVDLDKALDAISAHGVTILRDEALLTHGVQLIGIDDRDRPDALPDILKKMRIDDAIFTVLLYHRPDAWHAALEHNIDLTLSGHTHAGQMFPFGFLVKRHYPRMAGLFREQGLSMYVSVGTGTWGPIFRLGTQSEMSVIDLHQLQ